MASSVDSVSNRLRVGLILAISATAIVSGLLTSYRLSILDFELAWHSNLAQVLAAATAGLAFSVSGALGETRRQVLRHVKGYVLVTTATSGLLFAYSLGWPIPAAVLCASVFGALAYPISMFCSSDHRYANLALGAILALVFLLSIANYGLASAFSDSIGSVVLWALGDLTYSSISSVFAMALAIALLVWILKNNHKETPQLLLLGLGVGIAGPLFFLGWFTPRLVKRSVDIQLGPIFLLCCASVGAALAVLADAIPALLLGGYAPPLGITVPLVAIPTVIWWNRIRLQQVSARPLLDKLEALLILGAIAMIIFIATHVVIYAQSAT